MNPTSHRLKVATSPRWENLMDRLGRQMSAPGYIYSLRSTSQFSSFQFVSFSLILASFIVQLSLGRTTLLLPLKTLFIHGTYEVGWRTQITGGNHVGLEG